MKIELFSIKDNLVGFSVPFATVNESVALRQFIATVQSDKPNFCNTFPENKELWKVGDMDDQTGDLVSDVRFIARASMYNIVPKIDNSEEVDQDASK